MKLMDHLPRRAAALLLAVLMLVGFFTGAAAALLSNISLFCFAGAVAVLMFLSFKRKQAAQAQEDTKDEE